MWCSTSLGQVNLTRNKRRGSPLSLSLFVFHCPSSFSLATVFAPLRDGSALLSTNDINMADTMRVIKTNGW